MRITHYLFIAFAALVQPVLSIGQQTSTSSGGGKKIPVDNAIKAKINRWMANNGGIRFLENKGQMMDVNGTTVNNLLFQASGNGVDMYVTTNGISYVFTGSKGNVKSATGTKAGKSKENSTVETFRADMELVGANIKQENIVKEVESNDFNNYYVGSAAGILNVYSYERITVKNIYPGIDWVLYTAGGSDKVTTGKSGLQYDFIVHPGADPSVIRLRYKWTNKPEMENDGSIKVSLPIGVIKGGTPVSHSIDGAENIHTRYTLADREVGFRNR
jgi:hypothetical protein